MELDGSEQWVVHVMRTEGAVCYGPYPTKAEAETDALHVPPVESDTATAPAERVGPQGATGPEGMTGGTGAAGPGGPVAPTAPWPQVVPLLERKKITHTD
jgi:hypothetical protein